MVLICLGEKLSFAVSNGLLCHHSQQQVVIFSAGATELTELA